MPELPEVETIRRGLEKHLVGLKLEKVQALLAKQFQGDPKEVEGSKVVGVRRRGKITSIDFSNQKSLMIHLKLTGQLVFQKKGQSFTGGHPIPFVGTKLPAKATHIIFNFFDGSTLFFNDLRQFGWIKVIDSANFNSSGTGELSKLGPEPFTKEFNQDYLKGIFAKTGKPIKAVLMDQEKIAGVGNIYANDALFEAKVDPRRPAKTLTGDEIKLLFEKTISVLEDGLKYGGSSENTYVNVEGETGHYQDHARVYGRSGENCLNNCGEKIKRIDLGGRGTFFCPHCQK